MAKKQTRRSISVSRTTYERLKAFCEANNISMSQLVETRVNDFLGADAAPPQSDVDAIRRASGMRPPIAMLPPIAPHRPSTPSIATHAPALAAPRPASEPRNQPAAPVPMTSAAARFVVEPPPPIIKPKQETAAPKPAEKRPDQIFTF